MQNWEIIKNCHFLQVHCHRKHRFFWFSGKPLKMKENIPMWHQDNWNVKIHSVEGKICKTEKLTKILIFSMSSVIENIIFLLSGKPLKRKENIPTWQLKCKIHSFFAGPCSSKKSILLIFWKAFENKGKHPYLTSGKLKCKNSLILGQNMQNWEISKNCHFSQVRDHRKLQFFFYFLEAFENQGKHPYLTSGQLKFKNTLILGQNMQNWEISKNCHFSQLRCHRTL